MNSSFSPIGARDFMTLGEKARRSPRRRQHLNLHASYEEPCQRLLNAICADSYIRPHRHCEDPKDELLVVLTGELVCWTFDDTGHVADMLHMSPGGAHCAIAIGPYQWHTVTIVSPIAVILEIKAGPFDSSLAKSLAPWAPEEGSAEAAAYLENLHRRFRATPAVNTSGGRA